MKKIIISLVLLVSIGILSSSFKKTTQQIDVKKEIIGTWIQIDLQKSGKIDVLTPSRWVFTADGKMIEHQDDIINDVPENFTYTISHYGLANDYDSNYLNLILTDIIRPDLKFGYTIQGISKDDTNGKYYLSIEYNKGDGIPMVFVKK